MASNVAPILGMMITYPPVIKHGLLEIHDFDDFPGRKARHV